MSAGGSAFVELAQYRCDRAGDVVALTVTLHVDAVGTWTVAGGAGAGRLAYCTAAPDDPGDLLAVSPLVPRAADLTPY